MLVQLPREEAAAKNSAEAEEARDPFEAGLRRDLASAPIVSYGSVIGGWSKRAFDLMFVVFTAPAWAPVLLLVGAVARLRHRSHVLYADERIGYGGRAYRCLHLRFDRPDGDVTTLRPVTQASAIPVRRPRRWKAIERLPQLFNVLKGDMSLVGPAPLTRPQTEALKTAKRYYLSARPGLIGVNGLGAKSEQGASEYKVYSLCWSLVTDINLLLTAPFTARTDAQSPELSKVPD